MANISDEFSSSPASTLNLTPEEIAFLRRTAPQVPQLATRPQTGFSLPLRNIVRNVGDVLNPMGQNPMGLNTKVLATYPQSKKAKVAIDESKAAFRAGTNPVSKVLGAMGPLNAPPPEDASWIEKQLYTAQQYDPGVLFGGVATPKTAKALETALGGFGLTPKKAATAVKVVDDTPFFRVSSKPHDTLDPNLRGTSGVGDESLRRRGGETPFPSTYVYRPASEVEYRLPNDVVQLGRAKGKIYKMRADQVLDDIDLAALKQKGYAGVDRGRAGLMLFDAQDVRNVTQDMLEDITDSTIGEGGVTWNFWDKRGKLKIGVDRDFTYAIYSNKTPVKHLEVPASEFNYTHVKKFIQDNADDLTVPGRHLGTWLDDKTGKVHLDISASASTAEEAFAKMRKDQKAIFDMFNGKEITAPRFRRGSGERGSVRFGKDAPEQPTPTPSGAGSVPPTGGVPPVATGAIGPDDIPAPPPFQETLYHGGPEGLIRPSVQYAGKGTGNPTSGWGVFLTPDIKEANRYISDFHGGKGSVVSVKVALRNPYAMPFAEFDQFTKLDLAAGGLEAQMAQLTERANQFKQGLVDQGYDGIVIGQKGKARAQEVVAFNDDQIALAGAATPPPPGGSKYAGNINKAKFDPELHDLIDDLTSDAAQVEKNRRGTIGWKTSREGAESLARMTGGDPAKIEKALGQAYSVEEIELIGGLLDQSLREMHPLVDAVAAGDHTTLTLLKLQEVQSRSAHLIVLTERATAEAGRALQIFRKMKQALKGDKSAIAMDRVLKLIGKEHAEEFAQLTKGLDWTNPVAINNFIRSMNRPQAWDYAYEIFINSILSGPKTQIVNAATNAIMAVKYPLDTITAAMVDAPLSLLRGGKNRREFSEVSAVLGGVKQGIQEGLAAWRGTMKTGVRPDALAKLEFRPSAFSGKTGRVINAPLTFLEAFDQLFYSINYRMALRQEAYRAARATGKQGKALWDDVATLAAQPTDTLIGKAHDVAVDRLFRRESGATTQALTRVRDSIVIPIPKVGKVKPLALLIPFIRTPVNLLKVGLENSPLGIFNYKLMQNLAKKSPEAADQLAKIGLGSMVAAGLYLYAKDGLITGALPASATERDRFYREGKLPFSIKIGNRWVSYQRLEPFNQLFSQVAALDQAADAGGDVTEQAGQITMTLLQNFGSQTYMSTLSDIMEALKQPEQGVARTLQNTLIGLTVPASGLTRTAAQVIDPTIRKPAGLVEAYKTNIPGLSQQVPARMNTMGETTERSAPWFPINMSTEKKTALNSALNKYAINIGFTGGEVGSVKLDRNQETEYQAVVGRRIQEALIAALDSPAYQGATPYDQEALLRKAAASARDMGKVEYITTSDLTATRAGDTPAIVNAKDDLNRVKDYLLATNQMTTSAGKAAVARILRAQDTGLDVAMVLNGYATKPVTDQAQAILSQRRNGGTVSVKGRSSLQQMQQMAQMMDTYYRIEDAVWSQYTPEVRAMAEKIAEFESGTDEQKLYARRLLKRYPSVLMARRKIMLQKKRVRANPTIDNLIRLYG